MKINFEIYQDYWRRTQDYWTNLYHIIGDEDEGAWLVDSFDPLWFRLFWLYLFTILL